MNTTIVSYKRIILLSPSTGQTIGCSVGSLYFNRKRIPAATESFGQSKRFCGDLGRTVRSKAGWSLRSIVSLDAQGRDIFVVVAHAD